MKLKEDALVVFGALLGGFAGYIAFGMLYSQGLYGMVVPGGFVGLGAGIFRGRTKAIPIAIGLFALCLSLYIEWHFQPFLADQSLGYFVSHLHHLKPLTLLMVCLGGAIGFWIPFRRLLPTE